MTTRSDTERLLRAALDSLQTDRHVEDNGLTYNDGWNDALDSVLPRLSATPPDTDPSGGHVDVSTEALRRLDEAERQGDAEGVIAELVGVEASLAEAIKRFSRATVTLAAIQSRPPDTDPSDAVREAMRECVCEGEFIWACGPECHCFHHEDPPPTTTIIKRADFDALIRPPDAALRASDTPGLRDWPTLANIIREVDGNHDLGAGELAQRIIEHPRFSPEPETK